VVGHRPGGAAREQKERPPPCDPFLQTPPETLPRGMFRTPSRPTTCRPDVPAAGPRTTFGVALRHPSGCTWLWLLGPGRRGGAGNVRHAGRGGGPEARSHGPATTSASSRAGRPVRLPPRRGQQAVRSTWVGKEPPNPWCRLFAPGPSSTTASWPRPPRRYYKPLPGAADRTPRPATPADAPGSSGIAGPLGKQEKVAAAPSGASQGAALTVAVVRKTSGRTAATGGRFRRAGSRKRGRFAC